MTHLHLVDGFELVPMTPDFKQQFDYHRDRTRRLARQSPCPVCEVPSEQLCDPKAGPLTPGGMHWTRYPQDPERIEGKNA